MRLPEFEWEVALYRALASLKERWFPAPPTHDPTRVARLGDEEARLRMLAQIIAGEPVRLLPARREGGIRGADLLVPAALDVQTDVEANRELLRVRVIVAAGMRRIIRVEGLVPAADGEARQVQAADLAARAAGELAEALPGFGEMWRRQAAACLIARPAGVDAGAMNVEIARRRALGGEFVGPPCTARGVESPPVWLWGPLIPSEDDLDALGHVGEAGPRAAPTTEAQAPPVEEVRRVTISEKALQEQVLQHTFEKVDTAEAFNGNVRQLDGADELDDQLQALNEVDLGAMIRGGDEAHAVLRADLGGLDVPDVEDIRPDEVGIPYDEWDGRAGAWRRGWCTVYPTAFPAGDPRWAAAALRRLGPVIRHVERRLAVERTRRREVGRQPDGDDVDIDALVDSHAELRAHRADVGRVWLRRERLLRDVSLTVLLDASLSADAWVADRRVLDVSRDAVLVLGELAHSLGDAMSVLAFASSTRHRCRVWSLKGFHEPWPAVRARLGAVVPQGYTRIGAALRHAIACARARPEAVRLVCLITDGRPTDYDRYEGAYGMADIRMALREAARDGVIVRALAVDPGAQDTLPAMFGTGGWQVLRRPDDLVPALAKIYEAHRRVG